MEEVTTIQPVTSPTSPIMPKKYTFNFNKAIEHVLNDRKVSKQEWKDENIYICLFEERLKICLPDGLLHDLILSEADLRGEDWFLINDPIESF